MKVILTEFYMHPRYNFDISYRVFRFFESTINKTIRSVTRKDDTEQWIILDTKRIQQTKIGKRTKWGPRKEPHYKIIVYLPYEPLKKSRHFQRDFILIVCDALREILVNEYQVPEEYIHKIKELCLAEIPGNPKYVYVDG